MMYASTLLLNIRQKVGILIVFYPGSLKRTLFIGTLGVLFAGCNEPRAQEMVTCGDRCHVGLLYFPLPPPLPVSISLLQHLWVFSSSFSTSLAMVWISFPSFLCPFWFLYCSLPPLLPCWKTSWLPELDRRVSWGNGSLELLSVFVNWSSRTKQAVKAAELKSPSKS